MLAAATSTAALTQPLSTQSQSVVGSENVK